MNTQKTISLRELCITVLLTLSVTAPVWAQGQFSNSELVARLEEMQSKHEWQARIRTGKPRQLLLLHQARLSRILDELKSGKSVTPNDIAALYTQHYRDVPGQTD